MEVYIWAIPLRASSVNTRGIWLHIWKDWIDSLLSRLKIRTSITIDQYVHAPEKQDVEVFVDGLWLFSSLLREQPHKMRYR